ncbi:ribonuclease E inhibitor RraB [Duganella sp. Leaf126]|uniref:ribonuclease E inhibitor RraB n=1 Tax=Duganella sp. Leaf126 TaxID=1736266 RepID=UPI0019100C92|nr:ribonuclease E inhibitor RraB [Duganella sp. Leaf126]
MFSNPSWPNDADGDVFRRMQKSGFDFDKPVDIDFNVDFDACPPSAELVNTLRSQFKNVKIYSPDSNDDGYVQFVLNAVLTYELVMSIQKSVSEMAAQFGGVCESWGVLQEV